MYIVKHKKLKDYRSDVNNDINNTRIPKTRHNHTWNIAFNFLLFMILANISYAATISGTIYDLALEQESDVVVEIDTIPKQMFVSKDGLYSFHVNPGSYTLHAYTSTSESIESLVVTDDGEFILDIVLGDNILDPWDGISDPDIDVSSGVPTQTITWEKITLWIIAGFILSLIFLIPLIVRRFRNAKILSEKYPIPDTKPKQEDIQDKDIKIDQLEHKILSAIKKEKRTTQKDIRKEVPLSEAKISLILTDLEDKGKIRKIKKGRGNVLIFIKD